MNNKIEVGHDDWQRIVAELQEQLAVLQPELVAMEAQLSDQLASISAFEFKLRSYLEPLTRRLDRLQDEITELQKRLRHLQDSWLYAESAEDDDLLRAWRSTEEAGAAADSGYRYHTAPEGPPPPAISGQQAELIKNLYRQLARRFHPDFALNDDDRAYRTNMMMAINAAYTIGDLQKLEQLSREPDPFRPDYTYEEMAMAMLREVDRCQGRIAEINEELQRLEKHPSALLKVRADRASKKGRDLFEELASELRDRIAERMVQRDAYLSEIEAYENGEPEFVGGDFADAVFNLGLEQALMDDGDLSVAEWRDRHRDTLDWGDDEDEDGWDNLRRARQNSGK